MDSHEEKVKIYHHLKWQKSNFLFFSYFSGRYRYQRNSRGRSQKTKKGADEGNSQTKEGRGWKAHWRLFYERKKIKFLLKLHRLLK